MPDSVGHSDGRCGTHIRRWPTHMGLKNGFTCHRCAPCRHGDQHPSGQQQRTPALHAPPKRLVRAWTRTLAAFALHLAHVRTCQIPWGETVPPYQSRVFPRWAPARRSFSGREGEGRRERERGGRALLLKSSVNKGTRSQCRLSRLHGTAERRRRSRLLLYAQRLPGLHRWWITIRSRADLEPRAYSTAVHCFSKNDNSLCGYPRPPTTHLRTINTKEYTLIIHYKNLQVWSKFARKIWAGRVND